MFKEIADEIIYLFGDRKPVEVVKEIAVDVLVVGVMMAAAVLWLSVA